MYETWLLTTLIVWLIVGGIFGVACGKLGEKRGYEFWTSFALGFFLGLIGLIIVLVREDRGVSAQASRYPAGGGAEELLKYKNLLDEDAISTAEYEEVKARILSGTCPTRPKHSAGEGNAVHSGNDRDGRGTVKGLLFASIVLGAILITLMVLGNGMHILFTFPVDENYLPVIPAFFQAAAISAIAGALLYSAYRKTDRKLARIGLVLSVISLAIAAFGVLFFISLCLRYERPLFDFFSPTSLLGLLNLLSAACVVCQTAAAYIVYAKYREGGN